MTITTEQAVELLKGGPEGISEWNGRRIQGDDLPSLCDVDLSNQDLRGVNLSEAFLDNADLSRATLSYSNLEQARLFQAKMIGAKLHHANLCEADLTEADLSQAVLEYADLSGAQLEKVDLAKAVLQYARFIECFMEGTNLDRAQFGGTVIACDLSQTVGLDEARHRVPSHVTFSSIQNFNGNLPKRFLRLCRMDKRIIDFLSNRPHNGHAETPSGPQPISIEIHNTQDQSKQEKTMGDINVNAGGDINNAAIGHESSFKARDITTYKGNVDNSTKLDSDLKEKLKEARDEIENAGLSEDDEIDVTENLGNLTEELEKDEPEPGRVQRFLNRVTEIVPNVKTIVTSVVSVARLLGLG